MTEHPYAGFIPFDRGDNRAREDRTNQARRRRIAREATDQYVTSEARRGRPEYVAEATRRGLDV